MQPRRYKPGDLCVGILPTSIFHNVIGMVATVRTDCDTDIFDFGCTQAMLPPFAVRSLKLGERIDTSHDA